MANRISSALADQGSLGSTLPPTSIALRCLVALVLIMSSGYVTNTTVYASMASFFAIGREIGSLTNALAFAILAIVALRRPSLLNGRVITLGAVVLIVAGHACLGAGVYFQSPLLMLVGLLCRSAGSAWVTTLFSIALSMVSTGRSVLLVAVGSTVLSGAVSFFTPTHFPTSVACVLMALYMLVPLGLVWKVAEPSLAFIRQGRGIAIRDLKEFVPLAPLILCMFFMAIASGYAIAFNQQNDVPVVNITGDAIVTVTFIVLLISRTRKSEDLLFSLSVLLVVAGYLVAPYEIASSEGFANALLFAGRDCFYLLLWVLLAFVGRRNLFILLPLVGLVRAASSLGTDVGATVGHATNLLAASNPHLVSIFASIMLFAFVATLWLGFRRFSFTDAVSEVRSATPSEIEGIGNRIDAACHILGKQHGLTPRETEILTLLAKGRDGKFIAEKYVLSYQTVKTHIKHLYAKLGVHSRQELINLTDLTLAEMSAETTETERTTT